LDTAPIIYFVERHPTYFSVIDAFFNEAEQEKVILVTSPITLAECLYYPYKLGNESLQNRFLKQITQGRRTRFVPTTAKIAQESAELRAKYSLGFADSLQVATAILANCQAMWTNDKGWQRVAELDILLLDNYL
jgi:predicted nucleic acid-binding protein